jgi:hypothetical protein
MNLKQSDRLYRLLLYAYPAAFRREYGPEMAQLFRDTCRDAYRQDGSLGRGFWMPILVDLMRTALQERVCSLLSTAAMENVRTRSLIKGMLVGALLGLTLSLLGNQPLADHLMGAIMGGMAGAVVGSILGAMRGAREDQLRPGPLVSLGLILGAFNGGLAGMALGALAGVGAGALVGPNLGAWLGGGSIEANLALSVGVLAAGALLGVVGGAFAGAGAGARVGWRAGSRLSSS